MSDPAYSKYEGHFVFSIPAITKVFSDIYTPVGYRPLSSVTGLQAQTIKVNDMVVVGDKLYLTVGQQNIVSACSVVNEHLISTGELIRVSCDSLADIVRVGKVTESSIYKNSNDSKIRGNLVESKSDYKQFSWPNRIVAISPDEKKFIFTDEGVFSRQQKADRFIYFDLEKFIPEANISSEVNLDGWNGSNVVDFSQYTEKVED